MVILYYYPSKKKLAGVKDLFNLVWKKGKKDNQWLKVKPDKRSVI